MTISADRPQPKGLYYGWSIVGAGVLSQIAANGLAINCMSLFLRDWSKDLHTPISQLLLAILALAIVASICSPLIGMLADKYPARLLFGGGLVGMVVFTLGMSAVTATWQVWVLYGLVFPISLSACTSITANAVVTRWFVKRRGLALGITAFGVGIAGVFMPPLIAVVMPAIGWRGVWRITAAVIAFVVLPLVMFVMKDRPTEREGLHYLDGPVTSTGHGHGLHGRGGSQGAGGLRFSDIIKRKNFWLLVAVYVPIIALNGAIQQNMAPLALSHGFDQKTAGLLLSALSLSHVVATLAMGVISDRFGNRLPLIGLAVMVAAGGVLMGFGASLPSLMIGAALLGLGGGIYTLLPAAAAVEFGAAGTGRAFGLLMLFIPINAAVPSLVARARETTGSYGPALTALSIVALIGGALVLFMRERSGGHPTPGERDAALEEMVKEELVNPLA